MPALSSLNAGSTFAREKSLAIEAGRSLKSEDVVMALNRIMRVVLTGLSENKRQANWQPVRCSAQTAWLARTGKLTRALA